MRAPGATIAVVDTNVVVSGLLTSDPEAPTARILDAMLARSFAYVLSEALLAEYRTVLLRPRVLERHGLGAGEIDEILTRLVLEAIVVAETDLDEELVATLPDPGDRLLWSLVASLDRPLLVTGDEGLLATVPPRGRIVSPRMLVELLGLDRAR